MSTEKGDLHEHDEDSGPKRDKMEDTKPSDYPCNQPLDIKTLLAKNPGKYCNNAYQMHIGNGKILSWEGKSFGLDPEKAIEEEV